MTVISPTILCPMRISTLNKRLICLIESRKFALRLLLLFMEEGIFMRTFNDEKLGSNQIFIKRQYLIDCTQMKTCLAIHVKKSAPAKYQT